jgi:hypothetical protein
MTPEEKWARIDELCRTPVAEADILAILSEISELMGREVGLMELAEPMKLKEQLLTTPKSRLVCVMDGVTARDDL